MKKLASLLLLFGCLTGCKSSTEPTVSDPAVMPKDGSSLTYAYTGSAPSVHLTEHVTISDSDASHFAASIVSDTVDSVSTTSTLLFLVPGNGDLRPQQSCDCDTLPLPIATHRSYTASAISITVKQSGHEGIGYIFPKTNYLGQETIDAAGETFECSKVSFTDSIATHFAVQPSLDSSLARIHTYWYSSKIGYFVKEQMESRMTGGADNILWTRVLTGYKVGK